MVFRTSLSPSVFSAGLRLRASSDPGDPDGQKENDYVDAARAMGASDARIVVRHIFPNSVASIVVYATMNIGGAILTESALSFSSAWALFRLRLRGAP